MRVVISVKFNYLNGLTNVFFTGSAAVLMGLRLLQEDQHDNNHFGVGCFANGASNPLQRT